MAESIHWNIGCSGFSYRDWKPAFYPEKLPQREWLHYYSSQFNSLEANTTFYHIPRPATLQKWFEQTPDEFSFSVKAPRIITHYKKMTGTRDILMSFYDLVFRTLQYKLGCILFQFPPMFSYTAERLEAITGQLDNSLCNVVEFRHRSWWSPQVYQALTGAGIGFCSISYPGLPDEVVPGTAYFRFHGVPEIYKSPYTEAYIQSVVHRMSRQPAIRRAWIYFNNTMAATAIPNARYAQDITRKSD
jgi:uncharacterized protein YecE (DUF72 family)